jgi:CRP-like cAMP-binding protein
MNSRSRIMSTRFVRIGLLKKSPRTPRGHPMSERKKAPFDVGDFLAKAGLGRKIVHTRAHDVLFSQGTPADFYLQKGRAKLTVVSKNGKEATITLLGAVDFVGEESLAAGGGLRTATATSVTSCEALRIERDQMILVIHKEHAFSDLS